MTVTVREVLKADLVLIGVELLKSATEIPAVPVVYRGHRSCRIRYGNRRGKWNNPACNGCGITTRKDHHKLLAGQNDCGQRISIVG